MYKRQIVKKVKTKINQAVKNKDAVLFTRDTHGADYLDTQEGKKLPVPHCIRYTSGWQIEKSLQIPDARIFDKNTFGSLDLVHHLLCANCTEVEIVGVCTDICVVSNALSVSYTHLDVYKRQVLTSSSQFGKIAGSASGAKTV